MARIAMVHDVAGVGAVQAQILRQAGHEVDVIRLPELGAAWGWPAKALAMPLRVLAYAPVVRRLRRGRYDVVHIHWLAHGIVGVLARRRFFAQAHGSDLHVNLGNPLYRRVTQEVLRRAHAIFYVTPNLRAYMSGFEDKLRFLPNPVDVDVIAPDFSPPLGISRILVFTRIDPVKGVDQIFPAAEGLSRIAEVTALDWGPLSTEYMARYGAFVKFVKPVDHSRIGAFIAQFDVIVGQMKQGILSLSEIEAMAAGRPVITGIELGLYLDDPPPVVVGHDSQSIVDAVRRLKEDPAELSRLARDGREWVRRNHGYKRHLGILEETYFGKEALAGTPTAR